MVAPLALFALGALGAGAMEYGNRKSAKAAEEDRAKALQRAVEYSGILGQPRAPGIMGGAARPGPTMNAWQGLPRTQQENSVLRYLDQAGYRDEVVKMIQGRMAPQQRAQPLSSEGKQAWDMGLRPGTPAWNNFMSTATAPKPEAPPGTKPAFDTQTQRPVFVTNDQIFKYPDRFQPVQSGMEIESDGQGGLRLRTNVPGNASSGGSGATPTTQTRLQESLLNTTDNISRLNDIKGQFRPEFQQLGGRWDALRTTGMEKLGFESSPEEQQYLKDFSAYRADAIDFLNNYISTISGAQVSAEEAARLTAGFPNPGQGLLDGDSPTQFLAKLEATNKRLMSARARAHYALNQGLSTEQMFAIPLGSMSEIVDQRGLEIEQQVKRENPELDKATLQNIVAQRLKQEFGV